MVKRFENTFTSFDRINERDGQTDGHSDRRTPHDGIGRDYAWHRAANITRKQLLSPTAV